MRFDLSSLDQQYLLIPSGCGRQTKILQHVTYVELAQRLEQERQEKEQERQRAEQAEALLEQEQLRAQALEAKLRELGINPEQL